MKSLQYLFLALVLITSSCKKNKNEVNSSDTFWKCEIDGQAYEITGQFAYAESFDVDSTIAVYGSEDPTTTGYQTVYISFKDSGVEGSYDLGLNGGAVGTIFNTGTGITYVSGLQGGGGTMNVSNVDADEVEGTFEFTAVNVADPNDTVVVSGGSFKVRF